MRIRRAESSEFCPKSGIGFPIRFYPIRLRNAIGLHKNSDRFFRSKSEILKLEIRSHQNQPCFDVKMWRYRVDVMPNLRKCLVPVSMLYLYLYLPRYRRPYRYRRYRYPYRTDVTEISGTDIDVTPKLPKCPVPVSMSYRTYRSVRYRSYRRYSSVRTVPNTPLQFYR